MWVPQEGNLTADGFCVIILSGIAIPGIRSEGQGEGHWEDGRVDRRTRHYRSGHCRVKPMTASLSLSPPSEAIYTGDLDAVGWGLEVERGKDVSIGFCFPLVSSSPVLPGCWLVGWALNEFICEYPQGMSGVPV